MIVAKLVVNISILLLNFCHKKQETKEYILKLCCSIYFQGTYPVRLKVFRLVGLVAYCRNPVIKNKEI